MRKGRLNDTWGRESLHCFVLMLQGYFVQFKLNYPDTAGFKLGSDIFSIQGASDSFLLSVLCDAHRRVLSSFVSFDLKCSFRCVSYRLLCDFVKHADTLCWIFLHQTSLTAQSLIFACHLGIFAHFSFLLLFASG